MALMLVHSAAPRKPARNNSHLRLVAGTEVPRKPLTLAGVRFADFLKARGIDKVALQ